MKVHLTEEQTSIQNLPGKGICEIMFSFLDA